METLGFVWPTVLERMEVPSPPQQPIPPAHDPPPAPTPPAPGVPQPAPGVPEPGGQPPHDPPVFPEHNVRVSSPAEWATEVEWSLADFELSLEEAAALEGVAALGDILFDENGVPG